MYNVYTRTASITRHINQLARKNEMGRRRALYGRSPEDQMWENFNIIIILSFFVVPMAFGSFFLAILFFRAQDIGVYGIGVFFSLCGCLLILVALALIRNMHRKTGRDWLIAIYADGCIIQQHKDEPQLFLWQDIEAVWQKLHSSRQDSELFHQSYRIRRADGYEVTLTKYGGELKKVVEVINEHLCERMLPHLLAQYSTGGTVSFGPCDVSQEGISVESGERRLLPWSHLANVEIEEASLVIYQNSVPACWAQVPVATIPNLPLFLKLIEQIRTDSMLQTL